MFEESDIPYKGFVSLLQSRKLVNTQITIRKSFNSIFNIEMLVILLKPNEEKELKFIMFYSNNNTNGEI